MRLFAWSKACGEAAGTEAAAESSAGSVGRALLGAGGRTGAGAGGGGCACASPSAPHAPEQRHQSAF